MPYGTIVQRSVDYMWNTQWLAPLSAFTYSTVTCTTGGLEDAPDLNGLILPAFGWVLRQSGNGAYRTAGDAILAGAVARAWLQGSKQFNQTFSTSYQYFGWR